MKYQRRPASCLICKEEITHSNLSQHQKGKQCGPHPWHRWAYKYSVYHNCMHPLDIIQLLEEAGITPDQVGKHRGDYCLARYGDKGKYQLGNCRFITMEENIAERVSPSLSQEWKEAKSKQMKEWWSKEGKNRVCSEETRQKFRERTYSPETRKKLSDSMKARHARKREEGGIQ